MGKNLTVQKRGKGSSVYKSKGFRALGVIKHRSYTDDVKTSKVDGKIEDLLHSPGHYAPIAKVRYGDGDVALQIAPHGVRVGDIVSTGKSAEVKDGNTLPLSEIPEGTLIYNIESSPGDGGKFVRSSGSFARLSLRKTKEVSIMLPSKREKSFHPSCRATIGVIAGGGRPEKPMLKAGKVFHKKAARGKHYPKTSALAMNAVAHPFGGTSSSTKGRPLTPRRNAPPGAKAGSLRAKQTGRGKGRR